jgi:hypothetical protein
MGVALEIWRHFLRQTDTTLAATSATLSLYYYPFVRRGLSIEAGFGLSDYRMIQGWHEGLLFENADRTPWKGKGWAGTLALGYDVRVSHNVVIKPRTAYAHGSIGSIRSDFGTLAARRWRQNVLSLGVGLVFDESAPEQ